MTRRSLRQVGAELGQPISVAIFASLAFGMFSRIPLGRFVEPGEVADVILFLLSDRSSMVSGSENSRRWRLFTRDDDAGQR